MERKTIQKSKREKEKHKFIRGNENSAWKIKDEEIRELR